MIFFGTKHLLNPSSFAKYMSEISYLKIKLLTYTQCVNDSMNE